jgi:hypothetical protein
MEVYFSHHNPFLFLKYDVKLFIIWRNPAQWPKKAEFKWGHKVRVETELCSAHVCDNLLLTTCLAPRDCCFAFVPKLLEICNCLLLFVYLHCSAAAVYLPEAGRESEWAGSGYNEDKFLCVNVPRQCPLALVIKVGWNKIRRSGVDEVDWWEVEEGEEESS